MKISVVIPNLNGQSLLEANLPLVLDAAGNEINHISEVIVVDDASKDGSVRLITSKFPQVKLIKHRINRGFSAAVNTGVRSAKGDLILLLNTDVAPERDFLAGVLPHFEDRSVFAVSLHEKGYGPAKGGFSDGFITLSQFAEGNTVHESFFVSGGSGIFRRKIWMILSGMDEKLLSPYYWDDLDICYRALKRGYRLLWEPNGVVIHKHESTIGKLSKGYVERIKERNQLLVIWKNITSANLTRKHIGGLFARLIRHPGYLRIILMALGKLGVVLGKRRKEIKEAKISDEAIFARF